jgi:hypothetical protein
LDIDLNLNPGNQKISLRVTWGFAKDLTSPIGSPMPAGDAGHKISRCGILMGVSCLLLLQMNSVEKSWSKTPVDYYKLYAHSLVIDFKEFQCLEKLWTKESNWNPASHNKSGGAYGIPQMKNKKLKNMDAFTQIQWGLRYVKDRYQTPCNAWAYWLKNKHY